MTEYAFDSASPAAATSGLPWGTTADGELDRKGRAAGFIFGTLAVFLSFPLGVLGIVLNSMGLDRIKTNPIKARKLIRWSWVCFVPGTIAGLALLAAGVAAVVS